MKRTFMIIILLLSLLMVSCAGASGLLPSLTDTVGKALPSLGEALGRYPDTETINEDGSSSETFQNVSESDFSLFSVYLDNRGAILADYHISGKVFTASIIVEESNIIFSFNIQSGVAQVVYPSGTYDQWLENAKKTYQRAESLINEGKAYKALLELKSIPFFLEYGPAANMITGNQEIITAVAIHESEVKPYRQVGKTVTFGHYPHNANGTDNTEIEWIVLDYDEDKDCALLISRYGLDAQPYNIENTTGVTWKTCYLRLWLNESFLYKAFSSDERQAINITFVDNSTNQHYEDYRFTGEQDTEDKIFLLSDKEAQIYMGLMGSNNMASRISPTKYAQANGAYTSDDKKTLDGDACGWWWLRSPGKFWDTAEDVGIDGSRYYSEFNRIGSVRPVLWVNLESLIIYPPSL